MTKATAVAEFIVRRLEAETILYQEQIVLEIQENFGDDFVYVNEYGNLAIDRNVLDQFRRLTPQAVWQRSEKCWRKREDFDEPGRRGQE